MEDSAVVKLSSAQRGLLAGTFYKFERVELEKGEDEFGVPDPLTTKSLKPGASYEKLDPAGIVRVGTAIVDGDVLIGMYSKIVRGKGEIVPANEAKFKTVCKSLVYRGGEPCVVDAVMTGVRGPNDELVSMVKLRFERKLRIGDKASSRSGNKSIVARLEQEIDMPFTTTGMTPDIIINCHSVPSRMVIGQMLETSLGKVCARRGIVADGTAFLKVSIDEISAELVKSGFRYNGRERMFNGKTGEYFDMAMFIGPTYQQRLQKFVLDEKYAVGSTGPTDATTGQPLAGKNVNGGLRLGEMENWVMQSHGSMRGLYDKYTKDSGGRKEYLCRGCGMSGEANIARRIYECPNCGEAADLAEIQTSKAAVVLRQELAAGNVRVSLGVRPREMHEIRETSHEPREESSKLRH